MISVTLLGLERLFGDMQAAVDEEAARAMHEIDQRIADSARAKHPFANRTGDLQRSIVPGLVTGSLSGGDLRGVVLGDMPYGIFVDTRWNGRFAFLQPAWDREESNANKDMEQAFQRALLRVL